MNNDIDLIKAFNILDSIDPGKIYDISKIPKDRRDIFIECAKTYNDIYGTIEFNDSYTKIKKYGSLK